MGNGKQIRVKSKQGRNIGSDPTSSFQNFIENYEQFDATMKAMPQEKQDEVKAQFNAIREDFGDELFAGKDDA